MTWKQMKRIKPSVNIDLPSIPEQTNNTQGI